MSACYSFIACDLVRRTGVFQSQALKSPIHLTIHKRFLMISPEQTRSTSRSILTPEYVADQSSLSYISSRTSLYIFLASIRFSFMVGVSKSFSIENGSADK